MVRRRARGPSSRAAGALIGWLIAVGCPQANEQHAPAPPEAPTPGPGAGTSSAAASRPPAPAAPPGWALEGARWSGASDGVLLSWNDKLLEARVGDRVTFRDAVDLREWEGCTEGSRHTEVLSWVGPYLSLYRTAGGDCGGAHPVCSVSFETRDVRSGALASITDLFSEPEVLAALRADRYLRDTYITPLSKAQGLDLASLDFDALSEKLLVSGGTSLTRTGFYLHHVEGARVAVRVALVPTAHAVCGSKVELGLLLEIPPALRPALEAAQAGRAGFLGRDRPAHAAYEDGVPASRPSEK